MGSKFRVMLDVVELVSDERAGELLLERFIFVHLSSPRDKFELLVVMLRKLYAFVAGTAAEDNADALTNQELLLPGHLYCMFLKEKLAELLQSVRLTLLKEHRTDPSRVNLNDAAYFRKQFDRQADVGKKLGYFLATGNIVSSTGLDLMQASGFSVVADKLNWLRYLSHFQVRRIRARAFPSVHL